MTAARTVTAGALALLLGVGACGGGDDEDTAAGPPPSTASAEDQAAITKLAVEVVTSSDKDGKRVCSTLLTPNFVKTVFQDQKTCAKPDEEEDPKDLASDAT